MRIKADSKVLSEALRNCSTVTGAEHMNLETTEGELWVCSSGKDCTIRVRVEGAKVLKKGSATIDTSAFSGILKGREEITVESSSKANEILFASGRYNGSLVVPPLEKVSLVHEKKGKSFKLLKSTQSVLLDAIQKVNIGSAYSEDPIQVWVVADGKGTTVICADEYSIAHFHHPEVDIGKKNFNLPLEAFRSIHDLAKGASYSISLGESQIYAEGDNIQVVMPLMQSEVKLTAKDYLGMVASLKKTDCWFEVDKEKLLTALNNTINIYDTDSNLTLSAADGKLKLGFSSNYGKVNETMKVESEWKAKVEAVVDPALFSNILRPVEEKMIRVFYSVNKDGEGSNLFFKVSRPPTTVVYMCVVR